MEIFDHNKDKSIFIESHGDYENNMFTLSRSTSHLTARAANYVLTS